MDQNKRLLQFSMCAMAIIMAWQLFIVPALFPPPPKPLGNKKPPDAVAKDAADKPDAAPEEQLVKEAEGEAVAKNTTVADAADKPATDSEKSPAEDAPPAAAATKPPAHEEFPHQPAIEIGSLKPDTAYRMQVTLSSRGAVVSQIELSDPRYRELKKLNTPLTIVGSVPEGLRTFEMAIPALDLEREKLVAKLTSNLVDWEVVPGSQSEAGVTFRLSSLDGKLQVLKRFELVQVPEGQRDQEWKAYDLHFTLTFENLGKEPRTVSYELQGPVGMPLEGIDYTRKFRDVAAGFLEPGGAIKASLITAKEIAKATAANKVEEWRSPPKYLGVDVQYFAALLLPQGDQQKAPYLNSSKAMLLGPDKAEKSDVSIRVSSNEIDVPAASSPKSPGSITHEYLLFAGPKREAFLRPIQAEKIIDFGIAGRIGVPQAMLALLGFFQSLFPSYAWPYAWAIMLLTVVVRSAMFPFSRKQALSAVKMQEIQPEVAAIKKKYGNDAEKFQKAQMELYRKHNFNPLGGCLVMFVQLPIFIGLYQALNISVDLRSAKFMWINNLAAPDALFQFPFALPFLGNEFNLLPLITIGLFILQQKMFMPPPADKEQAMQQQMMSYMMIFMGFMFYSVPAGLCIYFIASSLWGLAERQFLPKKKPTTDTAAAVADSGGLTPATSPASGSRGSGNWSGGKGKSKQRR